MIIDALNTPMPSNGGAGANAQAMYHRLEKNITLIHQAMDEAEERIGNASWATADNNRSDPLDLAMHMYACTMHQPPPPGKCR
jgi:hypothetical protein